MKCKYFIFSSLQKYSSRNCAIYFKSLLSALGLNKMKGEKCKYVKDTESNDLKSKNVCISFSW